MLQSIKISKCSQEYFKLNFSFLCSGHCLSLFLTFLSCSVKWRPQCLGGQLTSIALAGPCASANGSHSDSILQTISLRRQIPNINWAARAIHELRNMIYRTVNRISQQNDRQKDFTISALRGCCCWRSSGNICEASGKASHLYSRDCQGPSQGLETTKCSFYALAYLSVPLKNIFNCFLVSRALWRSYSTEFQWNLTGKGQKESYEIDPHIFYHRDVPWLLLRGIAFQR